MRPSSYRLTDLLRRHAERPLRGPELLLARVLGVVPIDDFCDDPLRVGHACPTVVSVDGEEPSDTGARKTMTTNQATGYQAHTVGEHIHDQARVSADGLLSQGWDKAEGVYALLHGDTEALEARIGREATREEKLDLETAIRAALLS